MHRTLRYRLENVFPKLKEDMVFANIAAPLIQHCLLTDDEYEAVLALTNEEDRSEALLDYLSGKTDSAFYTFLDIVKVQHPWIIDEVNRSNDGDVVDGATLPRPKPTIISRNDSNHDKPYTSTGSLKRPSLTNGDPVEAKRLISDPGETRQSVTNAIKHSAKAAPNNVNQRLLNSQMGVKKDSCKCGETRCDSSDSVEVVNKNIPMIKPVEEVKPKHAQGVTEDMISIVKKNYRVCTRWTSLAHSLGLSQFVDKIQTKVLILNEDFDLRIVYLLREWLGLKSKDATLNALLIALRVEGFNDVADELEEKFTM